MLKAHGQFCPDRVPGKYELASVIIHADELLGNMLLRSPDDPATLAQKAEDQAAVHKMLIQAARALWRRSNCSRSPIMQAWVSLVAQKQCMTCQSRSGTSIILLAG